MGPCDVSSQAAALGPPRTGGLQVSEPALLVKVRGIGDILGLSRRASLVPRWQGWELRGRRDGTGLLTATFPRRSGTSLGPGSRQVCMSEQDQSHLQLWKLMLGKARTTLSPVLLPLPIPTHIL